MATPPTPTRLRVLVTSDLRLIGESVRVALEQRGHHPVVIRWPRGTRPISRRTKPPPTAGLTEVGLLLSELDSWTGISTARAILERVPVPWVAVTTSPRGPAWGGLLASGAAAVLPQDTGVERVNEILLSVASAPTDVGAEGGAEGQAEERLELEAAWSEACARHIELTERIGSLTPREAEVLRLMYAGSTAAEVSEALDVTLATVRTQVKGVLRKLHVQTQVAAVATFAHAVDGWGQRPRRRLSAPTPPASQSSGGRQPT